MREALARAELRTVNFIEMSCRVSDSDEWVDFEPTDEDEARLVLFAGTKVDGIAHRCRLQLRTSQADYRIEVMCTFNLSVDVGVLQQEEIDEHMNLVGLPTLVPYLREGLTTSAARLGVPAPVLPIVGAGAVPASLESVLF